MSGLLETSKKPRGPLADAAERFDRVAQVVKEQQLSETRSGQRVALSETYSASPDEAWAKKFMTQAIGPGQFPIATPAHISASEMPRIATHFSTEHTSRGIGDLRNRRGNVELAAPIESRKRSWLAWLLLGA